MSKKGFRGKGLVDLYKTDLQIDEESGLPVIDYKTLMELEITPFDEFMKIEIPTAIYIYKDVTVKVKGRNIMKASIGKLADRYPNKFDKQFEQVKYDLVESEGLELPDSIETMKSVSKSLLNTFTVGDVRQAKERGKIIKITTTNFQAVLSYFCTYEGFLSVYEDYLENVDEGVRLTGNYIIDECQNVAGEVTLNHLRATCHLLLLLMAKNFSNDENTRKNQVPLYMTNRLNSIRFSLKDPAATFLIGDNVIHEVNNYWNLVPKLKKAIFNWAMSKSFGEFTTAMNLLKNAAMSSIICVELFIGGQIKTRAHLQRKILKEVEIFYDTCNSIKEELGAKKWPYYRILHPNDTRLAVVNYPNLAYASLKYVQTYINDSDSYKRVINSAKPTIPKLAELVNIRLPIMGVDQETIGTAEEDVQKGLKIVGIPTDKIQGLNQETQVPGSADNLKLILNELLARHGDKSSFS